MRKIVFAIIVAALAVGANAQLVTCESINNVRHTCKIDVTTGVALSHELSKNDCVRGKTWGTTRTNDGIWVDGGCRAEFLVGNDSRARLGYGYPVVAPQTVSCGSDNRRTQRCAVVTSNGVQLTRQLSKRTCVENRDWGYDNNGIWVKNGCRAEFTVGGSLPPMASSMASTLVCESGKGMNHRCSANTMGGVMLSRQLSDSACIRDKSWGYDANGVWVSDGCRAEFILGRTR